MPLGWERKTTLKATMSPTTKDLAWAAGFLEGEACFGRSGGRGKYQSERIWCGQKDPECLQRLLAMFGGRIGVQHQQTTNLIKTEGVATSIPIWTVSGSRARGVMQTIYSFMSERRKTAIRKALQVAEFKIEKE